ncbi:MAG: hypothetical protein JXA07_03455 [Spirochaetes bacterium]|nr:hypothetical protein [Spirochaetota bacterium]
MHSLSGAYEEALLKHVRPSGILERETDSLSVLDVGFGLGYNVLALIASLLEVGYKGKLSVVSLERDRKLLPFLEQIVFSDQRDEIYSVIRSAYSKGCLRSNSLSLDILFGDARSFVRSLPDGAYDAIFFDPFSPARNPELWSFHFFREMFRLMNESAILTTYSSAPQVRGALTAVGFIIGRGPAVGGKREGTLASKTDLIAPLSKIDMAALTDNIRSVPYRDEHLSEDPGLILERRKREIRALREQRSKMHHSGTVTD